MGPRLSAGRRESGSQRPWLGEASSAAAVDVLTKERAGGLAWPLPSKKVIKVIKTYHSIMPIYDQLQASTWAVFSLHAPSHCVIKGPADSGCCSSFSCVRLFATPPRDPRWGSRGERSPLLPLEARPDSPGEYVGEPRPALPSF